ncbi:MAG: hypothetical protein DHS80DRAFT_28835 [Piptocephalis tieghemiana]|nr:MAG: hypothetical protein DHS80DRAFT_28835 [Piptocephalis tieghemiana]
MVITSLSPPSGHPYDPEMEDANRLYRNMSNVQSIYTPTASSIPDAARHAIRKSLHMEHAVDTTRFNGPVDMDRPPIGMTDAIFGGRDFRSSQVTCPPSVRGETHCIHPGSYPRAPPPGPGSAHFGSLGPDPHPDSHTFHRHHPCRSPSHSLMGDHVASSPTPPGLVSLDDSRWSRTIIPDRLIKKPSGVRIIQYDDIRRRAFLDPTLNCRAIHGRSVTFHHPSRGEDPHDHSSSSFSSDRTLSFPHPQQGSREGASQLDNPSPNRTPYRAHDTIPAPPTRRREPVLQASSSDHADPSSSYPSLEHSDAEEINSTCPQPVRRTRGDTVHRPRYINLRERLFGWKKRHSISP